MPLREAVTATTAMPAFGKILVATPTTTATATLIGTALFALVQAVLRRTVPIEEVVPDPTATTLTLMSGQMAMAWITTVMTEVNQDTGATMVLVTEPLAVVLTVTMATLMSGPTAMVTTATETATANPMAMAVTTASIPEILAAAPTVTIQTPMPGLAKPRISRAVAAMAVLITIATALQQEGKKESTQIVGPLRVYILIPMTTSDLVRTPCVRIVYLAMPALQALIVA